MITGTRTLPRRVTGLPGQSNGTFRIDGATVYLGLKAATCVGCGRGRRHECEHIAQVRKWVASEAVASSALPQTHTQESTR